MSHAPSLPVREHHSTKPLLSSSEVLERVQGLSELRQQIHLAYRGRHADSTNTGYDYWWQRFVAWCEDDTTRSVDVVGLGEFSVMSLIPTSPEELAEPHPFDALEQVILVWLTCEFVPTAPEGVDLDDWIEDHPGTAPSTLNTLLAALRARVTDHQPRNAWNPSSVFTGAVTGIRRALARLYGPQRQATPLLLGHVEQLAASLALDGEPPTLTADRLILEMITAGIDRKLIGRCGLDAYHPAGVYLTDQGSARFGSRLVIPGRRRRGGHQDAPTVIELDDHPLLHTALAQWLLVRPDVGDHLLGTITTNLCQRVSDSLWRTATAAGVEHEWNPTHRCTPTPAQAARMRAVLATGSYLDRSLVRERDLVGLLVGFFAALRRSELCALAVNDVRFDVNTAGVRFVEITIGRSKTDQEAKGHRVYVFNPNGGEAAPYTRVVDQLAAWIQRLRNLGHTGSDPLFPVFERNGQPRRDKRGHVVALDPQDWSDRLHHYAVACQVLGPLDPTNTKLYERIRGHSLRRGFVTTAIKAGIEVIKIAKHTRHKNVQSLAVYADQLLAQEHDWSAALFATARTTTKLPDTDTNDIARRHERRIAELEAEVARVRAERDAATTGVGTDRVA